MYFNFFWLRYSIYVKISKKPLIKTVLQGNNEIKTPEPEFRSFEAIELEFRAINAWRIAERDERL